MPRPSGPPRPTKQFHVLITKEEHRRIKVVAAHEGKDVSELFRELFLPLVDRRYEKSSRSQGTARKARTA